MLGNNKPTNKKNVRTNSYHFILVQIDTNNTVFDTNKADYERFPFI